MCALAKIDPAMDEVTQPKNSSSAPKIDTFMLLGALHRYTLHLKKLAAIR